MNRQVLSNVLILTKQMIVCPIPFKVSVKKLSLKKSIIKKVFWSIEIDKPFPDEKTVGRFGNSKKFNKVKLIFWSNVW